MEQIARAKFLNRLIERRENGLVKVITGIRGCGKTYLLFRLYYQYLLAQGVDASRILRISLEDDEPAGLLDRKKLGSYIRSRIDGHGMGMSS